MKVLITGDKGLIGRHLTEAYDDHYVVGVDFEAGQGDDCRDFFRQSDQHFDLVFHCAANVGGRKNIDLNPLNVALNAGIDAEMFDWAVRTGQERVVYFSSSAVYPVELQRKNMGWRLMENDVRLEDIRNPDAMYGMAKLYGEMCAQIARRKGVKVHVFRPFSGYAEDQDPLEYPFPALIQRAVNQEDPFIIWGDGSQVRDWIHLDDVVGAIQAVIKADPDAREGPINLGTGIGTTFTDLAALMCHEVGYTPEEYRFLVHAPQGVYHRVANPEKMLQFYTPVVTLEEGIRRAVSKMREKPILDV